MDGRPQLQHHAALVSAQLLHVELEPDVLPKPLERVDHAGR